MSIKGLHVAIFAPLIAAVAIAGCGGNNSDDSDGGAGGSSAPALTSKQVVAKLDAAGLEAARPRPMENDDFGLAPKRTDDATRFLIPSLGSDSGGRVLVFTDTEDLEATKSYYDKLGESSAAFASHTFANEDRGVLLQLNGELPKAKAEKYGNVVQDL